MTTGDFMNEGALDSMGQQVSSLGMSAWNRGAEKKRRA